MKLFIHIINVMDMTKRWCVNHKLMFSSNRCQKRYTETGRNKYGWQYLQQNYPFDNDLNFIESFVHEVNFEENCSIKRYSAEGSVRCFHLLGNQSDQNSPLLHCCYICSHIECNNNFKGFQMTFISVSLSYIGGDRIKKKKKYKQQSPIIFLVVTILPICWEKFFDTKLFP